MYEYCKQYILTAKTQYKEFIFSFIVYLISGFFPFMFVIQHCSICRPSDSTVSEDAGIETSLLRLWHWDTPTTRLDLIHNSARSHPLSARFHPHPFIILQCVWKFLNSQESTWLVCTLYIKCTMYIVHIYMCRISQQGTNAEPIYAKTSENQPHCHVPLRTANFISKLFNICHRSMN